MSDPDMIDGIIETVSIPVMAKARIGHFVEAQVLQSLGVDYIDESEVLTPADYENHIDKWAFTVPFVCGATNLGEALRRIAEGAAMIRSKGEAGTGDVSNATTHMRRIGGEIRRLTSMSKDELYVAAKELQAPYRLVAEVAERANCRSSCSPPAASPPRRRGDDDAARRRRRVRGLGHLQVRQPGGACQRHRAGDAALRRPVDRGQGLPRPG
jgi:pyridoxal 5'-phosphate synthase pdxS subunit